MPSETLTVPASELRIGDHVVNLGDVHEIKPANGGGYLPILVSDTGWNYWAPHRLLAIERHNPEVVERWVTSAPEFGFSTYEDAAENASKQGGRPIVKYIYHDGVLRSVEIVENAP